MSRSALGALCHLFQHSSVDIPIGNRKSRAPAAAAADAVMAADAAAEPTLWTKNRTLLKRIIIIPIFSIKSFHLKAVKIVVINEVLSNWFLVYYTAVIDWLCEAYTQCCAGCERMCGGAAVMHAVSGEAVDWLQDLKCIYIVVKNWKMPPKKTSLTQKIPPPSDEDGEESDASEDMTDPEDDYI